MQEEQKFCLGRISNAAEKICRGSNKTGITKTRRISENKNGGSGGNNRHTVNGSESVKAGSILRATGEAKI
ncbi:protein NilQ [Xenorhabdus kozodoii]|uniref:protein NilQ n=1 Tax=Xenorhabdus kozodoii TaxID=351676 RepID=UPI000C040214|nr:protein NilQ [Xenorhabdus kozodoii]